MVHLETLQLESQAPTSVHLEALLKWLRIYPCRAEASYLVQGFKEGFCIPYEGRQVSVMSRNVWCINGRKNVVRNKIRRVGRQPSLGSI